MEDLGFFSILNTLSQVSSFVPVLDSYFFKDDKSIAQFVMSQNTLVKITPNEQVPISMIINSIVSLHSLRYKLLKNNDTICYVINKTMRVSMTLKDLKEFFQSAFQGIAKIQCIQIAKPQFPQDQRVFLFKIEYSENKYTSALYVKKERGLVKINNHDYFEKAKDISRLLVLLIEEFKHKKVLAMNIEFISDDNFKLWIAGVTECKVIYENDLNLYTIQNQRDLKSIPKQKKNISNKTIENKKISKKRKFPVIVTPDLSQSDNESESEVKKSPEKNENFEPLLFMRRNSLLKREKKKRVEGDNDEQFRDLVEIYSKTFAKFEADSKGRLIKDEDVLKESKRITAILSPEVVDNSRNPSMTINDLQDRFSPLHKKKSTSQKNILKISKSNPSSRKNSEFLHGLFPSIRIKFSK